MNKSAELELLNIVHSSWPLDSLYLFLVSPIGFVGTITNTVSFITLFNVRKSNKVIYKYIRIYTVNSAFGSLIQFASFVGYSPRYFQFSFESFARFYRCIIFSFVGTTLYFFANLLDIVLAIERLSLLKSKLKTFKNYSPYLVALVPLTICTIINLPTLFLTQPKDDQDFFNATLRTKNYCTQSPIFRTQNGRFVTLIVFFVRDFLTIEMEIVLSVLSLRKLKEMSNTLVNNVISNFTKQIEDCEKKLVFLTFQFLIVSTLTHLVVFLSYLSYLIGLENIFNGWLAFFSVLSLSIRHSCNFFLIFYYSIAACFVIFSRVFLI